MERILIYLPLIAAARAQFQIHTQHKSLVAEVGSDITLPCSLTPSLPAAGLEVRWFRDLYHNVAFLLTDGREDRQQQSPDYRGRAFLLAGPEKGDLSLNLSRVRLSDTGKYHCFVENATARQDEEGIVALSVVGSGTPPLVEVALQDSSVMLSCSSKGWFPKPIMVWGKGNGDPVQADPFLEKNVSSGLFHVRSTIQLKDASEGNLFCGLHHPVTKAKTGVYVAVSDDVFPRSSPWAIAFWVLFVFSLGGFVLVAWFFYWKQKEKERQLQERDTYAESLRWEVEWRKISVTKESVLFDALTAFSGLLVSPDDRIISTTDVVQDVPPHPMRFDTEPCVLGQTGFRSGTHYWETEILERSGMFWSLGIAGESVRRTGGQRECPDTLIWAIRGTNQGYSALSSPPEPIPYESGRIQRVGIYLDYNRGRVSFYDVDTYRCLYTFIENFAEPVYPFYYVGPGIAFSLTS